MGALRRPLGFPVPHPECRSQSVGIQDAGLAILVFLIAAQVHVWVEAVPARNAGHFCGVCAFGAWAIFSAAPGLTVTLLTLRLVAEPERASAQNRRSEASAPRAPPLA